MLADVVSQYRRQLESIGVAADRIEADVAALEAAFEIAVRLDAGCRAPGTLPLAASRVQWRCVRPNVRTSSAAVSCLVMLPAQAGLDAAQACPQYLHHL
jgi:hypothetical protein